MSIEKTFKNRRGLFLLLEERLGDQIDEIVFPPAVFTAMQGEMLDYDIETETLNNRFPILIEQLNPYGNMQGGIIAATIDNTIGPLSMLVAPPNFTRYMKVKYSKIIPLALNYIYVTAIFKKQNKRQLFFEAFVKDKDGNKLASAESTHWVIDDNS